MRKRYLVLASAILISTVLSSAISTVSVQSNGGYDPWIDLNDDGTIDIFDIVAVALAFGASGTPINKTALLLDLEARVDALNATVTALQGQLVSVHVESGEFDGEVNSDMVEDSGVTTINFATAFTSTAKPQMVVIVVLKQSANGLVEGVAIKVVEDIKGAANNWTGFDLTVSKYSDGSSIDDTTLVYVTWIAIGHE